MDKKTIVLLYGGRSGEHEISLRSAAFVFDNIDRSCFNLIPVGISKDGVWYLQSENCRTIDGVLPLEVSEAEIIGALPGRGLLHQGKILSFDLVFPVLHGSFGEDGTVQGLLELIDKPYAGADVLGCALSMDKALIKKVWQDEGLPVVPFASLLKGDFYKENSEKECVPESFQKKIKDFGLPLIVKPANAGSSLGVSRIESYEELNAALAEAFRYDVKLLVEPCLSAREIECSVIGNNKPRTFAPGEIVTRNSFYDYESKYTDPDGAELLIPADLPEKIREELMSAAITAYSSAGVTGMGRVDFFVDQDDNFFLNELNAIPGFTSISMYPMMCAAGGLGNMDLISELIELGFERYKEKNKIQFKKN